jgi:hypothetical protein
VIHTLDLGVRGLDPADPMAYRRASGIVITADAAEAEVALPPQACRPGVTRQIVAVAASARAELASVLPTGCSLSGYSTHISVQVPNRLADRIAWMYCERFASSMMLLLDTTDSPGLLIRPRPGRIELGGDYRCGHQLRAAVAFAIGSVLSCQDAVTQAELNGLPPAIGTAVELDDQRYGWFVPRTAFGGDLYLGGRQAALSLQTGPVVSAQQQLEACWQSARQTLVPVAADDDVQDADEIVASDRPLPAEVKAASEPATILSPQHERSALGLIVQTHRRPTFETAPVMATWDVAVLVAASTQHGRHCFIAIPRDSTEPFLRMLNEGHLDDLIADYLNAKPGRRTLTAVEQLNEPGLFDGIGPRARLIGPERAAARAPTRR